MSMSYSTRSFFFRLPGCRGIVSVSRSLRWPQSTHECRYLCVNTSPAPLAAVAIACHGWRSLCVLCVVHEASLLRPHRAGPSLSNPARCKSRARVRHLDCANSAQLAIPRLMPCKVGRGCLPLHRPTSHTSPAPPRPPHFPCPSPSSPTN